MKKRKLQTCILEAPGHKTITEVWSKGQLAAFNAARTLIAERATGIEMLDVIADNAPFTDSQWSILVDGRYKDIAANRDIESKVTLLKSVLRMWGETK